MSGILSKLIDRDFGFRTRLIEDPITNLVQPAATQILRADPNRLAFFVINYDVGNIVIAFNDLVTLTRGILLTPGGGGINFKWYDEFDVVGYELWAWSVNANAPIYVKEIVGLGESV